LSDQGSADSRLAQQETWRKRLAEAEARYNEAAAELQQAVARQTGVVEARARVQAARAEYLRVLRIFSDLVFRGKAPEADE
jgi:hypothetical protein